MTVKRCVLCGKDMSGEDDFTETCYHCQDKSLENFTLIASTLNSMLEAIDQNEDMAASSKNVRLVAIYEAIKFFGEVPVIEVAGADNYLDETHVLIQSLNDMIEEIEGDKISEENAWKLYSLVHAVKEYGGTPVLEFYKTKHGSEIKL